MSIEEAFDKAFDKSGVKDVAEEAAPAPDIAPTLEAGDAPDVADEGEHDVEKDAAPDAESAPEGQEAEAKTDPDEDVLGDVPQNLPADWKNVIKINPATKPLVLKQFQEGNRLIYKKSAALSAEHQQLSEAHTQVKTYLQALTTDIEPVIKERFGGDTNAFAAGVNRLVKGLFHPQEWRRYEAIKELAAAALPNGFDEATAPDPHQRQLYDMAEQTQEALKQRIQPQPAPQQQAPQQEDRTATIQSELDNISRYNGAAKEFIGEGSNAQIIIEKYRQATEANPDLTVGAAVVEAVNAAMKEKHDKATAAAAQQNVAAKRQIASGLSFKGGNKTGGPSSGAKVGLDDAFEKAWAGIQKKA